MNCHECKENLNAYLDGELDAAQAEAVVAHARDCVACGQELEVLRKLCVGIAAQPRETVPDDFLASVRAKIRAENAAPSASAFGAWLRALFAPQWNWEKIPAAAVALLLITVAGVVLLNQSPSRRRFDVAMKQKEELKRSQSAPATPASAQSLALQERGEVEVSVADSTKVAGDAREREVDKFGLREKEDISLKDENAGAFGDRDLAKTVAPTPLAEPAPVVLSPAMPKLERRLVEKKESRTEQLREEDAQRPSLASKPAAPRARPQPLQIFAFASSDIAAARDMAIQSVYQSGGKLLEYRLVTNGGDGAVLVAQVPSSQVTAVVGMLSKLGDVSQVVPREKAPIEFAKVDSTSVGKLAAAKAPTRFPTAPIAPQPKKQSDPVSAEAASVPTAPAETLALESQQSEGGKKIGGKNGLAGLEVGTTETDFIVIEIQFQQTVTTKAKQTLPPQKKN